MERVSITIFGRVQGIGFRGFIKTNAKKLDLKGFVKNKEDYVEAIFEGNKEAIEKIIHYCKKGPLLTGVRSVKIKEEKYKGEFETFSIEF